MLHKKNLLPLRLQLFAESGESTTEQTNEAETQEQEEKAFTQADLDKAIAERLKRETNKANKTIQQLQSELETFKNANKTDEERQSEEAETLKATVAEKDKNITALSLQVEAMKAGVPAEKLDRFIKLASTSEEEELTDKIAETLKEFPEFAAVQQAENESKPRFAKQGNPNGSNVDINAFDAIKEKYK